jgi:hypothetical protein
MKNFIKNSVNKFGQVTALVASSVGVASAAVPEGVTTALTGASTDGTTIGYAIFGVLVALFGIKVLRRVL